MALAEATLQHEPNLRLVQNWHSKAPEGPVDDDAEPAGSVGV